MNDYYVYVYIDPRNHEEFYYGKGSNSRKDAHLKDKSDSEKAKRIRDIQKERLDPTVRVIAQGLSEDQALLVEKTLLWKLGKGTTNIATGHFKDNFRPANTLHRRIPGFDYPGQVHYFNVGDGKHRCWEDNVTYSYLGAGQGMAFRTAIKGLNPGDIVIARLNRAGYVGIGRVMSEATPAREFRVPSFAPARHARGKLLINMGLRTAVSDNLDDNVRCEYMVAVKWIKTVDREKAFWKKNAGLFAQRGTTRASLANQPKTIEFVQRYFGVNIEQLADAE